MCAFFLFPLFVLWYMLDSMAARLPLSRRRRRAKKIASPSPRVESPKNFTKDNGDGDGSSAAPAAASLQVRRGPPARVFDWTAGVVISNLTGNPQLETMIRTEADQYIADLEEDPAPVEPLVQVIAARYLDHLSAHPEQLDPLVQKLGDRYIQYLNDNPDAIQELVRSEGLNLGTWIVAEVRAWTVVADTLVERLARSLFRRVPRQDLPEPPIEVKRRAILPLG